MIDCSTWSTISSLFGSDRSSRSHFVCPSGTSLSRAVNLHLSRSESNLRAIRTLRKQSDITQRAIREQLDRTQRNKSIKIRVKQSDP